MANIYDPIIGRYYKMYNSSVAGTKRRLEQQELQEQQKKAKNDAEIIAKIEAGLDQFEKCELSTNLRQEVFAFRFRIDTFKKLHRKK
jgi:flagellin-specific chaperone FliS